MKVTVKKTQTGDIGKIILNAQQFSMLSYEFEEKREQSLINQSSQMLTAFSIITVVLLMLAPIVISVLTEIPAKYVLFCLSLSLILLVASMICAILVQWRFKYQALPSPMTICSHFVDNIEYFESEAQRSKSWIQTLNNTWESKRKINNRRVKLITASLIVFFSAIFSIVVRYKAQESVQKDT